MPPKRDRSRPKARAPPAKRPREVSPPVSPRRRRPNPSDDEVDSVVMDPGVPHVGAEVEAPLGGSVRPLPFDQRDAFTLLMRSMADLKDAQDHIATGQLEMKESQEQLSTRMSTMARRQECNVAGADLQGPAGRTAAGYIKEVQHILIEVHNTHTRNEVLRAVDTAMSKLAEFLKVVKRADCTEKGWFIASKLVQLGNVNDKFEDRWVEAERANEASLASWKGKYKSNSRGYGAGNAPASAQGFDPSVGAQTQTPGAPQYAPQQSRWTPPPVGNQQYVAPPMQPSTSYPQNSTSYPQNAPGYAPRPPRDLSNTRCYFCSTLGHLASTCILKQNLIKAQMAPVNNNLLPITQNGSGQSI